MKSTVCASLLGLSLLSGCTQSTEQLEANLSKTYAVKTAAPTTSLAPLAETPVNEEDIAQANNIFTLQLFKKLAAEDRDSNVFCSPLNISTAFAQLHLGSAGNTTTNLSQTFGWKDNSAPHHQSLNNVLAKLTSRKDGPTINIANKLWLAPSFPVFPEYTERLKKFYAAELFAINFGDAAAAAKAINDWVSLKTEKKITQLLKADQISPTTQFIITSAIYFKADWATAFDKKNSKEEPFLDAQPSPVNMMHHDFKRAKYLEINNTQVLAIPYKNCQMSAYFVLPAKDQPLGNFIDSLTPEYLNNLISAPSLAFDEVITTLPSWKLSYNKSLLPTLQQMNLNAALDMSNMAPPQELSISVVQHNAFVEVNEKGTEAAAATAIVTKSRSTTIEAPKPSYTFTANRPFMYFIADHETQTVLFIGNIVSL